MKRTRLKAVGRRLKRRMKARRLFRQEVTRLSDGLCGRCRAFCGEQGHAHHVRPRSLGGSDDPRTPPEGNGRLLCGRCHLLVHMHNCSDWYKWIDSRNRSLAPDEGAPPSGGR